jgi:hypothetical protein
LKLESQKLWWNGELDDATLFQPRLKQEGQKELRTRGSYEEICKKDLLRKKSEKLNGVEWWRGSLDRASVFSLNINLV